MTRRKKKCERYGEDDDDDEDCACEQAKEEMMAGAKSDDISHQSRGGNSREVPPGASNHTVVNGSTHPSVQTSDALMQKEAMQGLVPLTT